MNKKYLAYGLLALGAVAAGWYVWGLSTITDRANVTKISIADVGLTWIKLNLTVTNFATVDIPFNGFDGVIKVQGFILSNVSTLPPANQKKIPSGTEIIFAVRGSLNWAQFAGLIPDIVEQVIAGNWKKVITQLQPQLVGTLFSNNLSIEVDMPLI